MREGGKGKNERDKEAKKEEGKTNKQESQEVPIQ